MHSMYRSSALGYEFYAAFDFFIWKQIKVLVTPKRQHRTFRKIRALEAQPEAPLIKRTVFNANLRFSRCLAYFKPEKRHVRPRPCRQLSKRFEDWSDSGSQQFCHWCSKIFTGGYGKSNNSDHQEQTTFTCPDTTVDHSLSLAIPVWREPQVSNRPSSSIMSHHE